MKESISFDKELKEAIKISVETLSKAVKSTLGPAGTNVMVLSEIRLPIVVNDGVTVAKKVKFQDPLQNHIANIIKTVSQNTENTVGDGTSTSVTLTEAIILEGLKYIDAGFSAVNITKGIHAATKEIVKKLDKQAIPVVGNKELLLQVSSISANNDNELGKIISEAFLQVGPDGQIEVKDSTNDKTYVEVVNGMRYESGYESNLFVNANNGQVLLENCNIFIYEGKLMSLEPIEDIIKDTVNNEESILIVADDYGPNVIDTLANIKMQHNLKVCAVKSPGYGDKKEQDLEDIAFITNTKIVSRRLGVDISESNSEFLGKATSVKVDENTFTVISSEVNKKDLKERVATLKDKVKVVKGNEKTEILERIARLSDGVAILYVSGNSPVEISEKKYRIEDAINATRASLEEGIIAGGGVTLLKLGRALKTPKMDNESQVVGFEILKKALEAPITTIVENCDENGEVVINEVLKGDFTFGYDAKDKEYKDLLAAGIIDPKKVTKAALTNASSVSQMILTLNAAIY